MLRTIITISLILVFLLSGCEAGFQTGDLRFTNTRAQATLLAYSENMSMHAYHMPVSENAPVYMRIANSGNFSDRLISVSSPKAESVIFISENENISNLLIPAGDQVALSPNQSYLLLQGLRSDLIANEQFELVLIFERAGEVVLSVRAKI
jgi:copper(I)-binding protein